MKRTLAVRREVLAELTEDEARSVAGGLSGQSCVGVCLTGIEQCLTHEWCTSLNPICG